MSNLNIENEKALRFLKEEGIKLIIPKEQKESERFRQMWADYEIKNYWRKIPANRRKYYSDMTRFIDFNDIYSFVDFVIICSHFKDNWFKFLCYKDNCSFIFEYIHWPMKSGEYYE